MNDCQAGWLKKRNKGARDRGDYNKQYAKRQPMSQYRRYLQKEMLRGAMALWLAKNRKPLTVDQIYSAMKPQFGWLSRNGVIQMLHANCEDCFKRVGDKFTYHPAELYVPKDFFAPRKPLPKDRQDMEEARRVWFSLRGIKDKPSKPVAEFMQTFENIENRLKEEENTRKVMSILPQLRMFGAAAAIGEFYETTNTKNSTTK